MQKAKGEIIGWIGSGDIYIPGALDLVRMVFNEFESVKWIFTNSPMLISETGNYINSQTIAGFRFHKDQASSDKQGYFAEAKLIHLKFYNDESLMRIFLAKVKNKIMKKNMSHIW